MPPIGDLDGSGAKKVKKAPAPSKAEDDFIFAVTREATKEDEALAGEDPEMSLGLTKIAPTPKEEEVEEEEEEAEEPEPPTIEKLPPVDRLPPIEKIPPKEGAGPEEEETLDEGTSDSEEEAFEDGEDLLKEVDAVSEESLEMEEVTVAGGRKVKVLRVKPSTLPPIDEGLEEDDGSLGIVDLGAGRPRGDKGHDDDDLEMAPPMSPQGTQLKREEMGKGDTIRRTPGLGIDVTLDEELVRKLSAPVLPQQFSYSSKAFHRQFRRHIIMIILPLAMYFFIFTRTDLPVEVIRLTMFLISMLLLMILASLVIYGVTPFYSKHTVTERAVFLKQGVYFNALVPLDMIKDVHTTKKKVPSVGVYSHKGESLNVLSNKKSLVEIELMGPMKLHGRKPVAKVVVNVDEPEAFVRTVREAISFMRQEAEEALEGDRAD